jgi:predicted dehydrogenase
MNNKKICIVGYGAHIRNTIIPSLNLNRKNVKIVTKKKVSDYETFSNIKLALKNLSKDYIFFNSTPPTIHYSTSKLILSAGYNVIVEKPLCLKVNQLEKLNYLAKKKRLFIFENMMYFYSKQFLFFKKLLLKKKIKEIDINFTIPSFRKNTFRKYHSINTSILYDLGCYPFSLISYFNFNFENYKVFYKTKNKKLNQIKVLFSSKRIKFNIILATNQTYENSVNVKYDDNLNYYLDYFFYGKKIKKINYIHELNQKKKVFIINDKNLFESILKFSNKKLLELSRKQFSITKDYLTSLNLIKKYIKL